MKVYWNAWPDFSKWFVSTSSKGDGVGEGTIGARQIHYLKQRWWSRGRNNRCTSDTLIGHCHRRYDGWLIKSVLNPWHCDTLKPLHLVEIGWRTCAYNVVICRAMYCQEQPSWVNWTRDVSSKVPRIMYYTFQYRDIFNLILVTVKPPAVPWKPELLHKQTWLISINSESNANRLNVEWFICVPQYLTTWLMERKLLTDKIVDRNSDRSYLTSDF
jgi:hypothetical protein